jgi:hypothetical protein
VGASLPSTRCTRRYWRDQRGNRDAEILVRGGDFIERDGRRYAVLDVDRKMVAAYAVVGDRLRAVPLASLSGSEPVRV